jgi:uncharacterized protein (TIGR03437 family)
MAESGPSKGILGKVGAQSRQTVKHDQVNTAVSHLGWLASSGTLAGAVMPVVLTLVGLLVGSDRVFGAEIIWAATTHGPHRSLDNGLTWEARQEAIAGKVGSLLQGGAQTWAVVIDPSDPDTAYFAASFPESGDAGAVLKTTDGGESFTASLLLGAHLEAVIPVGQFLGTSVITLAIDPVAVEVVYLYEGDPGTLYRTIDAGNTWARVDLAPVLAIAVDPSASGVVWAITRGLGDREELLRSQDFGNTWSEVPSNLSDLTPSMHLRRLLVDPLNSSTLYSYTGLGNPCLPDFNNDQCSFLRSDDAGATWASLGVSGGVSSAAFNREPQTYFAISGTPQFTILRSDDGGQTWPPVAIGGIQTVIFTDTQEFSAVFAIEAVGQLLRSTDQGVTWSQPLLLDRICDPFGPCPFGSNFNSLNSIVSLAFPSPAAGQPPMISEGGIVLATLLPTVNTVSPRSIISVFGQGFTTDTILFPNLDGQGKLDTILGGTCLMMNGEALPIFAVTPGQINAQASANKALGPASFTVITNCATAAPIRSAPLTIETGRLASPTPQALSSGVEMATVEEATPGFFLFPPLADDGLIAARFNADAIAVAPDGMFTDEFGTSRPAMPGEIIVLYGTGWGETTAGLTTGELATVAAELLPEANAMITFGGVVLAPEDVFYIGVTPFTAGLLQAVIAVPATAQPGNNQVVLTAYGKSTSLGPVIPVASP